MTDVIDAGQASGLRHFFYGSTNKVLDQLVGNVQRRFPKACVVGTLSPPSTSLSPADEASVSHRLNTLRPDVVWIALGTPAQDVFIEAYLREVPAVFVAVGAAFDFLSGSKRRAPQWMQKLAAEWLFRLIQEPKRLGLRYLIDSPLFFYFAATRR